MANKRKRGSRIYAICLSVYVLILLCASVFVLTKVWGYAEEYENSRPAKAMDEYVSKLSDTLWDDGISEAIATMPHEVQTDDECAAIIKEMLKDGVTYSRQGGSGDNEMTITYNLRCGENTFGKVTLMEDETKAGEVKYGLLPWVVYKEEFDFSGLYSSVKVTVPSTYSVELNGVKLSEEYIVESGIHYDVLEDYYDDYANLPTKVTYEFKDIIGKLEPVILDENGSVTTIDETKDDSQFIKDVSAEQRDRLNDFANNFTERYKSYISGIYDPDYGYTRLLPYIKLGSDLDERMKQAQDGLSWAHTTSMHVDSIEMNSAIDIGDGFYIIDITSMTTTTSAQGTVQNTDNMRVIVTDSGNDIRAVTLELY
ncbi:MAG: hypothetical protein VB039_04455 [Oscillospiraceae bacterium]|nr:hypothetical protein [Oscillospiraceae bacterium]